MVTISIFLSTYGNYDITIVVHVSNTVALNVVHLGGARTCIAASSFALFATLRRLVVTLSSHRMHYSNGFRETTPPQNRQLIAYYYSLKQFVDDFVGDLTS